MPTINYKNTSPYFETNQRNFLIEHLDFLEFREIPADVTDEPFVVPSKFEHRPDLLSNEFYGTPELWWVFAVRNPDEIIDPIYDIVSGKEIYVPTRTRVISLLGL